MTFWMASFGLDKSLHCFYVLFQLLTVFGYRSKIINTVLVNIKTSNQRVWPWLGLALFLDGANLLPDDGQFVGVDDFGLSAAVDELQRPVPLALSFTHHRPAGVLLHLCADPEHTHRHHHLHHSSQLHLISESTTLMTDLWTLPP